MLWCREHARSGCCAQVLLLNGKGLLQLGICTFWKVSSSQWRQLQNTRTGQKLYVKKIMKQLSTVLFFFQFGGLTWEFTFCVLRKLESSLYFYRQWHECKAVSWGGQASYMNQAIISERVGSWRQSLGSWDPARHLQWHCYFSCFLRECLVNSKAVTLMLADGFNYSYSHSLYWTGREGIIKLIYPLIPTCTVLNFPKCKSSALKE